MEIIKINNAYPGFEDSLVCYSSTASVVSGHKYTINTNAYNIIFAKITIMAAKDRTLGGISPLYSSVDIPFQIKSAPNGKKYIEIISPKNGTLIYYIMGSVSKKTFKNTEVKDMGASTVNWTVYHAHDGVDSSLVDVSNIQAGTDNIGKVVVVGSDGKLALIPSSITIPGEFTLLEMDNKDVSFSFASPQQILDAHLPNIVFNWSASSGADIYTFYLESYTSGGISSAYWANKLTVSNISGYNTTQDLSSACSLGNFYRWKVDAFISVTGTSRSSGYAYFVVVNEVNNWDLLIK